MAKDINRIKVVLVEHKRTNEWLAEQLEINLTTIAKWCNNTMQPNIEIFMQITKILNVEIQEPLMKDSSQAKATDS